jgi:hypothetical protein
LFPMKVVAKGLKNEGTWLFLYPNISSIIVITIMMIAMIVDILKALGPL